MTNGFSVRHMYRKLRYSLPTYFPCRSIWNPIVPPKLGFFCLGSFLGQGAYSGPAKEEGDPPSKHVFFM